MRVELGWTGLKFQVVFLDTSADPRRPNVPARDYLESLNHGGTPENPMPRYKAMIHRIQSHAARGPLLNIEHSRRIEPDLFELKTRSADRLIFFYDSRARGRTVLTVGCDKSGFTDAKRVASRMKGDWEIWQAHHPLD